MAFLMIVSLILIPFGIKRMCSLIGRLNSNTVNRDQEVIDNLREYLKRRMPGLRKEFNVFGLDLGVKIGFEREDKLAVSLVITEEGDSD